MKTYKERRLYYFTCEQCGKENRHSFKRKKAKMKVCKRCRKNAVDPNQQSLFEVNQSNVLQIFGEAREKLTSTIKR